MGLFVYDVNLTQVMMTKYVRINNGIVLVQQNIQTKQFYDAFEWICYYQAVS